MKFTFCWSICRLFGLIEFYRTMKRQFPIIKMASPIPNRDEVALVVLQMVDLFGRKCGEPSGFRILCQVGEPLNPFHWKRWFHCYVIYGLLKNFRMANFNPFELRTGRNISKYITHANLHAKYSIHGAYRYDSTRLKSSDVNYNFWKKP